MIDLDASLPPNGCLPFIVDREKGDFGVIESGAAPIRLFAHTGDSPAAHGRA